MAGLGLQSAFGGAALDQALQKIVADQRLKELQDQETARQNAELELRKQQVAATTSAEQRAQDKAKVDYSILKGQMNAEQPAAGPGEGGSMLSGPIPQGVPVSQPSMIKGLKGIPPVTGIQSQGPQPTVNPFEHPTVTLPDAFRQTGGTYRVPTHEEATKAAREAKVPFGVEIPKGGSYAMLGPDGKPTSIIEGQETPDTGAILDEKYQNLISKRNQGIPLTPQETADVKAYEDRKTLGPRTTFNLNEPNKENANLQKSFDKADAQLEVIRKPLDDKATKLANAAELIKTASPLADSLVAPALLVGIVGGQGSGVRLTQSEINRIDKGRGFFENIKAKLQTFNPDGSQALSLTPEQRQEMSDLVAALAAKYRKAQSDVDAAYQELKKGKTPMDHADTMNKIHRIISGDLEGNSTSGGAYTGEVRWDGVNPKGLVNGQIVDLAPTSGGGWKVK